MYCQHAEFHCRDVATQLELAAIVDCAKASPKHFTVADKTLNNTNAGHLMSRMRCNSGPSRTKRIASSHQIDRIALWRRCVLSSKEELCNDRVYGPILNQNSSEVRRPGVKAKMISVDVGARGLAPVSAYDLCKQLGKKKRGGGNEQEQEH